MGRTPRGGAPSAGLRRGLPLALLAALAAAAVGLARSTRLERADFAFNSSGEVTSLDPHTITGVPESRIMNALYEGLVRRDPDSLLPRPALAERWEASPDGLHWTFHLRPGARWSNGDPVTARDFEHGFRRLLEPETASEYAYLLWCVAGAQAYSTGLADDGTPRARDWGEVGVVALDARTLYLRLAHPTPQLLAILGYYPLFPVHPGSLRAAQERWPDRWQIEWLRPENLVASGPYLLAERRIRDRIRLRKNPLYWNAERVAFRTIDALSVEHWGTALNLYLTGEVDWLDGTVPNDLVPLLRRREDFRPLPYLGTYFLRVNCTRPPLDDARVRQALALTIHRQLICERILKAGQQPCYSAVPWGRIGEYESPHVLSEDLGRARELLEEAGFGPDGARLPTLEIHYNTSETHRDIAEVLADTWREALGVETRMVNQEWKVYLQTQAELGYDVSRSSWIADYADPLTFLEIWVSGGPNNRTGWSEPRFDALIAAARAAHGGERLALLHEAERILLESAPLLPIYSYVSQNLVNPRLGGFGRNPLNDQNPGDWYWRSDAELLRERVRQRERFGPDAGVVDAPGPRAGLYAPAVERERADAPPPAEGPR